MADQRPPIYWNYEPKARWKSLARYVQEQLHEIEVIVKESEKVLATLPPYDPNQDGYVTGNPERKVKALFEALKASGGGATYRVEKDFDARRGQQLRLAGEVLQWGWGNCIEWSLVFAACILNASLHPLIVLVEKKESGVTLRHAIVGYWTNEKTGNKSVIMDGRTVRTRCVSRDIKLFDATLITPDENGRPGEFEAAGKVANDRWFAGIVGAVDIRVARKIEGIEPLESADPYRYLKWLIKTCSMIDIPIKTENREALRFPIDDLYMTLTTALSVPGGDRRETESAQTIPLEEALVHPHLVITGDPGSGKTTFLRHLVRRQSMAWLRRSFRPAQSTNPAFPLFVEKPSELVKFIRRTHQHHPAAPGIIAEFFANRAKDNEYAWSLDLNFFIAQLEQAPCLLLLDGFDEAETEADRALITQILEHFRITYPRCSIVATSRPPAHTGITILPGFRHAMVDPLDELARETFLRNWSLALFRMEGEGSVQAHHKVLSEAIRVRPQIRRLGRNPFMLTCVAVLHLEQRRLPDNSDDLYDSVIDWLARQRPKRDRRPPEQCVEILQQLALGMQMGAGHDDRRQVIVTRHEAAELIQSNSYIRGETPRERMQDAAKFLAVEQLDNGIIVGRRNQIRFWHLTFQEFLAAKEIGALLEKEQTDLLLDQRRIYQGEWRETIRFFAGVLRNQGVGKVTGLLRKVLEQDHANLGDKARTFGVAGAILRELGSRYRIDERLQKRLTDLGRDVMSIFDVSGCSLPIQVRIEAAEALGIAGDPRIDPSADRYWIPFPAGAVWVGAQSRDELGRNYDKGAEEPESPVHQVHLDAYAIARYLVTAGEFEAFIDDEGYALQGWWSSGGFEQFGQPSEWESQRVYPNRPVTGVSWFEAMAYCKWFTKMKGVPISLPTEAQWERAARGSEGRLYPWGNTNPEPAKANYGESHINHSTSVGLFPEGHTPEGIADMAGNVWEWCEDWYAHYNAVSPAPTEYRVARGGAWYRDPGSLRSAFRNADLPETRGDDLGFRVVRVRRAVP